MPHSTTRASRLVPALLAAALAVTTATPALAQTATPTPQPTPTTAQPQAATVTIGISRTATAYTFRGAVTPGVAGVQVTIARLGTDGRVTGVAQTRTLAGGGYEVSTSLPVGFAGYYALTSPTPDLLAARSRLYGLIVNVRPGTTPTVTLGVRRSSGSYVFSGQLTPGRSVPVTLGQVVNGRLVGVVGTRSSATGAYSVSLRVAPGTHYFKVLTGAANGLDASSSRVYGLVVP